jgi:hypothetical protein
MFKMHTKILLMLLAGGFMTTNGQAQDTPIVIQISGDAGNSAAPIAIQTFFATQGTTAFLPQSGGNQLIASSVSGGFFGGGSPEYLLRMKQIQTELVLEEEQIKKITAAVKDTQARRTEIYKVAADIAPEKRREFYAEMNAVHQELLAEQISQILLPKQKVRLEQIQYQMQMKSGGAYAFQNPKLAAALGMTPEQLKKLQEKNLAANRELALEYQRLRKESQERILGEVLTKDQQKKIEALTGEKFELQPVQRGNFNVLPNGKKTSTNK